MNRRIVRARPLSGERAHPLLRNVAFAGVTVFLSALCTPLQAYLPEYQTRVVESANGEYTLVLLAPVTEAPPHPLRDAYLQSGLYRNDGSTEPLWTIDYLSTSKTLFVADDGVGVAAVYLDWHDSGVSDRGAAVELYANGQRVASYDESELLTAYLARLTLGRLRSSFMPRGVSAGFDDNQAAFALTTNWGDRFLFDTTTGVVIEKSTSKPVVAVLLLIPTTIFVLGVWLVRNVSRKRSKAAPSVG